MFIFTAMLIMRKLVRIFCLLISTFIWSSIFWHVARRSWVVVTDVSRLYVRLISKTSCSPKITTVTGQNRCYIKESSNQRSIFLTLERCFSTARPRPGTGPWHQLFWAARGSPGICHFSFLSIFHE